MPIESKPIPIDDLEVAVRIEDDGRQSLVITDAGGKRGTAPLVFPRDMRRTGAELPAVPAVRAA